MKRLIICSHVAVQNGAPDIRLVQETQTCGMKQFAARPVGSSHAAHQLSQSRVQCATSNFAPDL
jgi:hypothetical protein